jgi:hypothetical protein
LRVVLLIRIAPGVLCCSSKCPFNNIGRKPAEEWAKGSIIGFLRVDFASVCFVKSDVAMQDAVINNEINVRHLGCNFVRDSCRIEECVTLFHDNGMFPVVAKLVEKVGSRII